jgi:hypothetical protein
MATLIITLLISTAALAEPLPVPKPPVRAALARTAGCRRASSQGAQDAIAKPAGGSCPFGWMVSGSYCLRAENVRR